MPGQRVEARIEDQRAQGEERRAREIAVQRAHGLVERAHAQLGVETIEQEAAADDAVALDRQELHGTHRLAQRFFALAEPGQVAVPGGIAIIGSTYSQSGVARFLARLSVLSAIENVTLESSLSADVGAQRTVQFAIRAQVKSAAGAA